MKLRALLACVVPVIAGAAELPPLGPIVPQKFEAPSMFLRRDPATAPQGVVTLRPQSTALTPSFALMPMVQPNPNTAPMPVKVPDPSIDYKMIVKDATAPGANAEQESAK